VYTPCRSEAGRVRPGQRLRPGRPASWDHWKEEERKAKEQQAMDEKERRAALRGLVGFRKMVWKEFQMGKDVFE
jgi:hypothetical protein